MVAFLVFLLVTILSACASTRRRSSTGTVQDNVPKEEGIEVVHSEFTLDGAVGPTELIYKAHTKRASWAPHAVDGWYLSPAMKYYRCEILQQLTDIIKNRPSPPRVDVPSSYNDTTAPRVIRKTK